MFFNSGASIYFKYFFYFEDDEKTSVHNDGAGHSNCGEGSGYSGQGDCKEHFEASVDSFSHLASDGEFFYGGERVISDGRKDRIQRPADIAAYASGTSLWELKDYSEALLDL